MSRHWAGFWLLGILIGGSFPLTDFIVEEITPFELAFIRFWIAAAGLHLILLWRGVHFPHDWHSLRDMFFIGIGNQGIPFMLIAWGITRINGGQASVFISTLPLFSIALAHFFLDDEKMTVRAVLGVLLGFAGIVLLASRNFQDSGFDTASLAGQGAVLLASAMGAIASVYSRKVMNKELDSLVMATGSTTAAGIAAIFPVFIFPLFGLGQGGFLSDGVSRDVVLSIGFLSIFNTLLVAFLIYYTIDSLGATRSAMVTYVIAPISLVLSVIFRDELVDLRILIGTIIILGGLAITNVHIAQWRRYVVRYYAATHTPTPPG